MAALEAAGIVRKNLRHRRQQNPLGVREGACFWTTRTIVFVARGRCFRREQETLFYTHKAACSKITTCSEFKPGRDSMVGNNSASVRGGLEGGDGARHAPRCLQGWGVREIGGEPGGPEEVATPDPLDATPSKSTNVIRQGGPSLR